MNKKLICEACNENEAIGVACVPLVPMSSAYCRECLQANNHPMPVLIANTVCIGGLEHGSELWKKMVIDSLKHQGKTLDWFYEQVEEALIKQEEGKVEIVQTGTIFINPKFNPEYARPHQYQHSDGYPEDEHICVCGLTKVNEIHNEEK